METWKWRLRGPIWGSFWDGYLEQLWKAVRVIGKPEAEWKQIDTGGRVEGTGPILAPGMGVWDPGPTWSGYTSHAQVPPNTKDLKTLG